MENTFAFFDTLIRNAAWPVKKPNKQAKKQ